MNHIFTDMIAEKWLKIYMDDLGIHMKTTWNCTISVHVKFSLTYESMDFHSRFLNALLTPPLWST